MSKSIPANKKAVLKKAVGNANATSLLETIVYWCTRQKGGVEYEGRLWSYRSQAAWIELCGLSERTGKRVFKLLVDEGFILKDMRLGGSPGNRKVMMHVALSDNTYTLLDEAGVPHLQIPILLAEQAKEKRQKDKLAAESEAKKNAYWAAKAAETKKMTPKQMWAVPDGD